MSKECGIGLPDAEDAEVAQRTQKNSQEEFLNSFCALCETFASSASGSPISGATHG